MNHYDFGGQLHTLYAKAVRAYAAGQRGADSFFTAGERAFLAGNGLTTQNLFDYAEDHHNGGEPGWERALAIESVRRDYFLNVQHGRPSTTVLDEFALPPKTDAVRGIECRIEVAAEAEPEAVRAEIAWGDSPAMTNAPLRGQGWYRRQRLRFPELAAGGAYWCRVTATDPAGHCATSGVLRFDVPGRRPFEGVARRIPGTIQAEHYDEGIEGVTSHGWGLPERTFRGEQGFELKPTGRPEGAPAFLDGRQPEGAWLEYTADIATGGLYRLDVVCGGFHGRGGEIRLRQDGEDRTGAWALPTNAPRAYDTWTTSSVPVRLDAGRHVLRLELLRRHNAPLDRLVFEPAEERTARPRAAAGGIDTVAPSADTRPPRCPCPPTLPPTPPDSPRWTRP